MMYNNLELKFDEFLRSVAISKNNIYSLLLGAGCSITSGIQSANNCIWEWKKIIYKSNNPNAQDWIENYLDPNVQDVIQKWLDNQGTYIEKGNAEEYSYYAEKCFPVEENRKQYFQKICENKDPSIGYKVIPILFKLGLLDSVWTTNFDNLVRDACINGKIQEIEITLDKVDRINQRAQNRNELPIIKLHGDYKYGDIKNTSQELKKQDETLINKFVDYLSDKHLIVLGYSGRDNSLMKSLKEAYSKPGAGILFWCGYGEINKEVIELLKYIQMQKRQAFYINTDGFDNTMLKLAMFVVEGNLILKEELQHLKSISKSDNFTPFNLQSDRVNKVLKSNLLPIEFPKEVFVFDTNIPSKPWRIVKDLTLDDYHISAIPYRKKIWAFGTAEYVKKKFSDLINGELKRNLLIDINVYKHSINYLLLSSLCKLLSKSKSIKTNYKNKLWDESKFRFIHHQKIYNAITIGLEKIEGEFYLSLNPDFVIADDTVSNEIKQLIGLKFFHYIGNKKFNEYVDNWRMILFNVKQKINSLEFPPDSGSGFTFKITKNPVYTNVCDTNINYSTTYNVKKNLLKLRGIQFREVNLLFSTKNGQKKVSDIHPMRGLVNNMPYDHGRKTLLSNIIDLRVICPKEDSDKLHKFLNMQNKEINKNNPNDNYIIDFKGFNEIYGLSLNIPNIYSKNWSIINNPTATTKEEIINEIKNNICDKINSQCSIGGQKILIIYIPERWKNYLHYNVGNVSFDLHDYIKAYCAEKRVTSQIIKEETISDITLNCQINWWLSFSYFVKSFRTPWVIDNTDKTTAFAGIGYSVDKREDHKGHIILGCSHIYSSHGEGLKYKLSKVNDKIKWINKKPHLSYDDAYEFGINILNLFYDSMNKLPKRVVIHKRTFYTEDEKQGIIDSLYSNKKIENVDLIEINFENNIRYVSSKIDNEDNSLSIDGFPISRGTCIQLNDREALLYAHGVVPSVLKPTYKYYQGGRYIPKPLRIIKHHGLGSLEQIANEILGLTKMNWNSLNMYSQLPVTISSSNEIARIGKLIDNIEKIQYDYRYFI